MNLLKLIVNGLESKYDLTADGSTSINWIDEGVEETASEMISKKESYHIKNEIEEELLSKYIYIKREKI